MSAIEIVVHCFNGHLPIYAPLLRAQGLSLIHHSLHRCKVVWTVCYHPEDGAVTDIFDELESDLFHSGVFIRRIPLSFGALFQRSVGRNEAALSTEADCLWHSDCDYLFKGDCLDGAIREVALVPDAIVYPAHVLITSHFDGDSIINKMEGKHNLTSDDLLLFNPQIATKAIGGIQIVNGDLARSKGYVNYGKWIKPNPTTVRGSFETRSDVKYRGCIGKTSQRPIAGVCRIRHSKRSYGGTVVE